MDLPDQRRLRVEVSDERGQRVAAGGLGRWLARVAPARARGVVGVAVVDDRTARRLNRRYRGRNAATDVLSFPAQRSSLGRVRTPPGLEAFLGDIVIAKGVARKQARAAGHPESTELRVLALHGLLHLLGYDHARDREARAMARAERRLRVKGGLPTGLIERGRRGR